MLFCNNCNWDYWAVALMFELIAVPFHFLSFKKGDEGDRTMKCQWGGNSLNKLLASFCFSKRILWILIYRYLFRFISYNLLRREGRLKTRLFLHFSEGAISAATQIQLSVCASLGYKIIKGFGMKASGVSLLPHDFIVISLISAFSTSSSLPSRKKHRVKIFQTKWHWRKDTQCCWSLCSHCEGIWFCNFIFLVSENMAQPEFLEGVKEPRPRSQSLGMV